MRDAGNLDYLIIGPKIPAGNAAERIVSSWSFIQIVWPHRLYLAFLAEGGPRCRMKG